MKPSNVVSRVNGIWYFVTFVLNMLLFIYKKRRESNVVPLYCFHTHLLI